MLFSKHNSCRGTRAALCALTDCHPAPHLIGEHPVVPAMSNIFVLIPLLNSSFPKVNIHSGFALILRSTPRGQLRAHGLV
jgi:hypothetical protein